MNKNIQFLLNSINDYPGNNCEATYKEVVDDLNQHRAVFKVEDVDGIKRTTLFMTFINYGEVNYGEDVNTIEEKRESFAKCIIYKFIEAGIEKFKQIYN